MRIFAYFNNLVLISAFLGMGLGMALSLRRPGLARATPFAFLGLVSLVTLGTQFGLSELSFPDPSIASLIRGISTRGRNSSPIGPTR